MLGPQIPGMIMAIDGEGGQVRFQYNPVEIEGPTAVTSWASMQVAGRRDSYLQFSHGEQSFIRFSLVFGRRSDTQAVNNYYESLVKFTIPVQRGIGMKRPPLCMFIFGNFLRTKCIVKEVTPVFTKLFDTATLMPEYAKINILLWLLPRD